LQAIEHLLYLAELETPNEVFDHDFINYKTCDYEQFIAHVKNFKVDELAAEAGISVDQIREAADMLKHKSRIIICWAMGITQHTNGVATIREILNLALLKGAIGKPGAGLCPVRGHSNVQGNRTMLIFDKPKESQMDKLKEVYGFNPPYEHGYDVVESIKAMQEGKLKVLFAMGGNFLSATPDTVYTAEALRKLKLSVHVSTKLNRSHLIHGEEALILPALARSDKDVINGELQIVSCENSMGVVQQSKGMLDPISDQMMSESLIVCNMAKAVLGSRSVVNWDSYAAHYDNIRNDIEKVIPGFEKYNERVRKPGGFYLPNPPRHGMFEFNDTPGKVQFTISETPKHQLAPDEYMLTSIRSHDQFNTTIYGTEDRYRGIHNERRVLFINAADMEKAGFKAGDKVDLFSYYNGVERKAHLLVLVPYDIPERCIAAYYPETNVLFPIDSVALKSNTPTTKLVMTKIRPHQE
jgi:molybdopterin-dependent oxidoreductase alpha subunit